MVETFSCQLNTAIWDGNFHVDDTGVVEPWVTLSDDSESWTFKVGYL